MLRVALRPKYLGILALMVTATMVCGLLANWQFNRATESMGIKKTVAEAAPVPLESLMGLGDGVTNEIQGRLVRMTGEFDASHQALATNRNIDGIDAAIVVTDFRITQGTLAGASIPIARGYLPNKDALNPAASIPAPPSGVITIAVRLEAPEGATEAITEQGDAPLPVIDTISSTYLVNEWGGPMLAAYGAVTEPAVAAMHSDSAPTSAPAEPSQAREANWRALGLLPAAESAFSAGLNLQNLGYMLQWIVFGVFFLYIWWRTVRMQYLDEKKERRLALEARARGASEPRTTPLSSEIEPSRGLATEHTAPLSSQIQRSPGLVAEHTTDSQPHSNLTRESE